MSDPMTDADLGSIEDPHEIDYDSVGGCVCGESYPCTTRGLVAEVRRLRAKLEEAHLRSIEARNPGIDMERVRRERALIRGDDRE